MNKFRKSRPVIQQRVSGLILCEGETEEYYFKGFIKDERNKRFFTSIDVEIYKPKDHSPTGLIQEAKSKIKNAKSLKIPYKFVFVVFDRDSHQNIAKAFHDAKTFKPQIQIGFTIVSFEIFILLHFEKTSHSFGSCEEIIKRIEKYLPDYKKAQKNLFEITKPSLSVAKENSSWLLNYCKPDLDSGIKEYELGIYCNIHEIIIALEDVITNKI